MGNDCIPPDDNKIQKVPENIILEIFRYLSVKDRCIAGRVCKQWHRIVKDNSLWKHVDLLEYRLDLQKMWKVLRAYFSPCLLTIKIKGFAHQDSFKRKKASISDAMLKELGVRCPNLWLLHLHDCNTDKLRFESFPKTITSLSITNSTWQPRWLKGKTHNLQQLKTLNLSLTVRVDNLDLLDIAEFTTLKKLSLTGCYRIKGSEIETAAKNLQGLESLNLCGTGVDDLAIQHIAQHLKNLQELCLANCDSVGDSSLASIAEGLQKLNVLDLSHCESVSMKGLQCLYKLSNLKFFTFVRETKLTDEELNTLKIGFSRRIFITT